MSGNVISILGVLNTKDPEHPKPSRERKMELEDSASLTSDYNKATVIKTI